MRCRAPDLLAWERILCAGGDGSDWTRMQAKVFLFDPSGIRPGDFGMRSQATDGADPVTEGEYRAMVEDPAGGGIGVTCRRGGPEDLADWCVMRRHLREDLSFAWSATVQRATFEADLQRMEGFARDFCAETFGAGVCDPPAR